MAGDGEQIEAYTEEMGSEANTFVGMASPALGAAEDKLDSTLALQNSAKWGEQPGAIAFRREYADVLEGAGQQVKDLKGEVDSAERIFRSAIVALENTETDSTYALQMLGALLNARGVTLPGKVSAVLADKARKVLKGEGSGMSSAPMEPPMGGFEGRGVK